MQKAQSSGPYSSSFYLLCLRVGKVSNTKACKCVLQMCTDLSFLFFSKISMKRWKELQSQTFTTQRLSTLICKRLIFVFFYHMASFVVRMKTTETCSINVRGFFSFHCPILSSLGFLSNTMVHRCHLLFPQLYQWQKLVLSQPFL